MAKLYEKSPVYNKEYKAWIDEIMTEYSNLLKVIFVYPAQLFLLIRLSSIAYLSLKDGGNDETFWMPITVALILFFSLAMQKKYPQYSAVFILLYLEGFNFGTFVRYYIGQNKNNNFYPVISGFFTFFLQFFLFKINRWVLLFMQIKTMSMWMIVEVNQFSFDKNCNMTNLITVLGMSIFLTVISYVRDRVLGIIFRYRRTIIRDQNNLKTIIDFMPDGLVVLNDMFDVKLSNISFSAILDINLSGSFLTYFRQLKYTENKRLYEIGSNEFIYSDVENYLISGRKYPVSFGITQIDDKYYEWKGNLCKWNNKDSLILVVRDCTTLIELEKSQARQLYQTAVLRAISHELRTPTSAIISANENMSYELPRDDKYPEESLAVINVSGQLLLNLINNLLDFVQIESGTFNIFKSYFNLKELIEETFNLFSIQANLKGLRLNIHIDPSIPQKIKNDSERIKQVLINLLSNALKYTLSGSISLIANLLDNDKVRVTIRDTGIGMSTIQLSELFRLFGLIKDLRSQIHGICLKMHITNLLVLSLGNEPIHVESEVGQGSSFSFSINIGKVKLDTIESTETCSEHLQPIHIRSSTVKKSFHATPSKVLIVDDNDFNRYVLGEVLKIENIEFDEAINGADAVEMIAKKDKAMSSYKAVIMDCQMPVMDGWQATQKLVKMREEGKLRELPAIIGYSAYSSREDEIKSKEAGMSEFLQKPATRERLARELRKYL
jgi:signal transduction histidine kinase